MKKGRKTELILLALIGGVVISAELLDMMMMGGRNASYKKAQKSLYGGSALPTYQEPIFSDKQQFYSLLNHLKKQGLVARKEGASGFLWKITSTGLKKLKILRESKIEYETVSDNKLKIVAFDIPEKEKRKRTWLREVLGLLGFKMLQKSLWAGKNKIPEDFLLDLKKKNMLSYLHILEISKTGTLKELI